MVAGVSWKYSQLVVVGELPGSLVVVGVGERFGLEARSVTGGVLAKSLLKRGLLVLGDESILGGSLDGRKVVAHG